MDSDEPSFERFASDPFWTGFIVAVQDNQNYTSILPESPSATSIKSLSWAITNANILLDCSEIKKKEIILNYVTGQGECMFKFFELLAAYGATVPFGVEITSLIREFVNPRNGMYKQIALQALLKVDPLYVLFDILEEIQVEKQKLSRKGSGRVKAYGTHAINVNTIWIISAVTKKDPNFVYTILELGKVQFLHNFTKNHFFHPKNEIHYPCLKIFRTLVKISSVGALLGKDKFFSTLRKMMELYLTSPSTKFQIVLEIIVMMTRNSKAQCKRFLKAGCLITLMRVFSYWPLWKGHGLCKMTKCVLNVYLQLATTFAGRKALLQTDSLHSVRQFCENCPKDKIFDEVITRAVAINALTYGKHKLPFKSLKSPAKFDIVNSDQKKRPRDSGTSSDEDDPDDVEEVPGATLPGDGEDDEDIDSEIVVSEFEIEEDETKVTNDDEDEEIKEAKLSPKYQQPSKFRIPSVVTMTNNNTYENSLSSSNLNQFAQFFKELDELHENAQYYNDRSYESIVVGLLGRFITKDTHGEPIPKFEFNYHPFTGNRDYNESVIPVEEVRKTYLAISNQVRSVVPFVKVAYPEITFAYGSRKLEYTTSNTDRFLVRSKLSDLMQRVANIGVQFKPIVVYDLDSLLNKSKSPKNSSTSKASFNFPQNKLGNDDELNIGKFEVKKRHSLNFEARFEGGNLRKAIQVGEKEYDLYLTSDLNSSRHNQWFFFQVSNTPEESSITFNIVNCIKTNSQFNYGMQPVMFSVMEALDGRPGWVRTGSNTMYYRNGFQQLITGKKRKHYYTASFTINFLRKGDICYIAYHYPFSYSRLLTELWKMTKLASESRKVFVRYDMLCHSENDNEVPLVTVTGFNDSQHPVGSREIIFLSARVHPGEPNSSWVMQGILYQLIFGNNMEEILKRYIFKVVPMLNVEGVINGCGRCGLTGEDLNRRWKDPDPLLHPSIYHSKGLIEYSCKVRNKVPVLAIDLHGHSRRKNVFFYGCSLSKSWSKIDREKSEDMKEILALPDAMARRSPAFSLSYCKFDVRKQRESTARVALWREFGIARSYTLESTYCGCDRGLYKGVSIGIGLLVEVGEALCESCEGLFAPPTSSVSMFEIPNETLVERKESKTIIDCNSEASGRYRKLPPPPPASATRTKIKKKKTRKQHMGGASRLKMDDNKRNKPLKT